MTIKALIIDFDDTLSNRKQSAYNFYKDEILKAIQKLENQLSEITAKKAITIISGNNLLIAFIIIS